VQCAAVQCKSALRNQQHISCWHRVECLVDAHRWAIAKGHTGISHSLEPVSQPSPPAFSSRCPGAVSKLLMMIPLTHTPLTRNGSHQPLLPGPTMKLSANWDNEKRGGCSSRLKACVVENTHRGCSAGTSKSDLQQLLRLCGIQQGRHWRMMLLLLPFHMLPHRTALPLSTQRACCALMPSPWAQVP
jgi:hypothetical protein